MYKLIKSYNELLSNIPPLVLGDRHIRTEYYDCEYHIKICDETPLNERDEYWMNEDRLQDELSIFYMGTTFKYNCIDIREDDECYYISIIDYDFIEYTTILNKRNRLSDEQYQTKLRKTF